MLRGDTTLKSESKSTFSPNPTYFGTIFKNGIPLRIKGQRGVQVLANTWLGRNTARVLKIDCLVLAVTFVYIPVVEKIVVLNRVHAAIQNSFYS